MQQYLLMLISHMSEEDETHFWGRPKLSEAPSSEGINMSLSDGKNFWSSTVSTVLSMQQHKSDNFGFSIHNSNITSYCCLADTDFRGNKVNYC